MSERVGEGVKAEDGEVVIVGGKDAEEEPVGLFVCVTHTLTVAAEVKEILLRVELPVTLIEREVVELSWGDLEELGQKDREGAPEPEAPEVNVEILVGVATPVVEAVLPGESVGERGVKEAVGEREGVEVGVEEGWGVRVRV